MMSMDAFIVSSDRFRMCTSITMIVAFIRLPLPHHLPIYLHIVIPGDLEEPGWKKLLLLKDFRDELNRVNTFVASHHGRESGYCKEVFDYCRPNVIIFSDSSIVHSTQEMTNIYSRHANGIMFNGESRKVLTTRNDGSLTWSFN